MSERSYFSQRWAIPGFTFIFLIITLNYKVLMISLVKEPGVPNFSELFFGFLAILSGSGIGFLISQIWHCYHEARCLYYGDPRKPYQTTIDLYKLEKGYEKKKDKKRISSFFVYLLNSYPKQQRLAQLLARRGDLYHLFGSEITSLLMAIVLGWKIRIISHCRLGKEFSFCGQDWGSTTEWWVLAVTTLFAIIFICLLCIQLHSVNNEYNIYADLYVRNIFNENEKQKIYNMFSREYFNWSLFEINIPKKDEEILKNKDITSVYKLAKYDLKDHKKNIQNQICKDKLKKWICDANMFLYKSNI